MPSNKSVIKGVRLPNAVSEVIEAIARYEDRTVSKVIARFMLDGLMNYVEHLCFSGANDELFEFIEQKFKESTSDMPPAYNDKYEKTINKLSEKK